MEAVEPVMWHTSLCVSDFFFNDTATTEIYTLSLHDALPICWARRATEIGPYDESALRRLLRLLDHVGRRADAVREYEEFARSEEHTSELQSQSNIVCRLLLEKKKIHRMRSDHV